MRVEVIYRHGGIMLTRDFIRLSGHDREVIPIDSISAVRVTRREVGNYKSGALLFFLLGILTLWTVFCVVFFALGLGAWLTNIYAYGLEVETRGDTVQIMQKSRRAPVTGLAHTIAGLCLSRKVLTFAST